MIWKHPCSCRANLLVGSAAFLCLSAWSAAQPKAVADLAGAWQLLMDDSLVARKENSWRTYHPFTKNSANPVLVANRPWEGRTVYLCGTVLSAPTEPGYRMWYHSWSGEYRNLYATSTDAVAWTKPNLGLVEFEGSKANNIFLRWTRKDHLPQVIYTPWEKQADRRYYLIDYDYGRDVPGHTVSGFWGAYSSDGLHWQDVATNPVLKDPGDVGQFFWDPHRRQCVGYTTVFALVRGYPRRCVGFTATADFEHWPSAQLILTPDEEDDRWTAGNHQRTEFYGLSGFAYESAYLGFLWIFQIIDGKSDGPSYPELVSGRDGIHWIRQNLIRGGRVPILHLGLRSAWDSGMIFTATQPLREGGLLKLWFGGMDDTHGGPGNRRKGGIGLATLRKDGFVSLDDWTAEGVITTHALKHLQGTLHVNADARRGWLKVEVLAANGQTVVSRPVSWDSSRHHHLTVTYDCGNTVLYFDGVQVGEGKLQAVTAHLQYDSSVRRHFDRPDALPEVGIHLANSLFLGGDAGTDLPTDRDQTKRGPQAPLVGYVDDFLVVRTILAPETIRCLFREGLDSCKI